MFCPVVKVAAAVGHRITFTVPPVTAASAIAASCRADGRGVLLRLDGGGIDAPIDPTHTAALCLFPIYGSNTDVDAAIADAQTARADDDLLDLSRHETAERAAPIGGEFPSHCGISC